MILPQVLFVRKCSSLYCTSPVSADIVGIKLVNLNSKLITGSPACCGKKTVVVMILHDFVLCGHARRPLLNCRCDQPSAVIKQILCPAQHCPGRSRSSEAALLLLHHFPWCASHSSCGWGCVRARRSLRTADTYPLRGTAGETVLPGGRTPGTAGVYRTGLSGQIAAEVGRTAVSVISASACEAVFEVLFKKYLFKAACLRA